MQGMQFSLSKLQHLCQQAKVLGLRQFPLPMTTIASIHAPYIFTVQKKSQLKKLAILAKLIIYFARTNTIAQCAQIINMPLMMNVIISVLSVPMLMMPLARERSAKLANNIAKYS